MMRRFAKTVAGFWLEFGWTCLRWGEVRTRCSADEDEVVGFWVVVVIVIIIIGGEIGGED